MIGKEAMKYSMPAEWAPQKACWLAWPSHAELWGEAELAEVQAEFTALCKAIAYAPSGQRSQTLHILVPNSEQHQRASAALRDVPAVEFHPIGFGDIWLRDTAPLFVETDGGTLAAACFRFNGWGGKYSLAHDPEVSHRIAATLPYTKIDYDWVLEGGSVEIDGEGTCLTSEQCLLNPNRNPGLNRSQIEDALRLALGAEKVLWLKDGLVNDHTDGHIDTIARFTAPGKVVCMAPSGSDDPNCGVLVDIQEKLRSFTDARGRKLEVATVPSPGRVVDENGRVLAASYVNFYIANHAVVVPTYGVPADEAAVKAIAKLFPGRKTVGLSARAILNGGGAFHCITQQQPAPETTGGAHA